ncbi:hypothetical protein TruAng_011335 [Truncatella angustata]|nr:hypothetical protein TruAng_011335 [Truncatella angustata]
MGSGRPAKKAGEAPAPLFLHIRIDKRAPQEALFKLVPRQSHSEPQVFVQLEQVEQVEQARLADCQSAHALWPPLKPMATRRVLCDGNHQVGVEERMIYIEAFSAVLDLRPELKAEPEFSPILELSKLN